MKNKNIVLLYERLAEILKMPIQGTKNPDTTKPYYTTEWLKLDYNSYYGGYVLRVVLTGTGEADLFNRSRLPKKEFEAYLHGLIDGLTYNK